ncbi:hypothetical protein OG787_32540 [Streptomyces sp. NBC_00075]|uniref:Uncharacterized protein n=1 Tax=Streptomyces sp. NBC_00093 TaxID=2975649 RepID=A0AAU2A6Q1_9ACTN
MLTVSPFAPLTPERFDAPLYELPQEEWSEEPRDFTVTVAGPERFDGEEPYTYVVRDHTVEAAWIQALTWHMRENETLDAHVIASESHVGLPPADAGYHWNDLRPEGQSAAMNRTIAQARDLIARYEAAIAGFRAEDGEDIDPEQYGSYDETRADFGEEAIDLVSSLAMAA